MPKYYQVKDGEWYFPTMNKHKRGCCDCGLVHLVDTRIVQTVKGGVMVIPSAKAGLKVMVRSYRDDGLTKARRRQVKRATDRATDEN